MFRSRHIKMKTINKILIGVLITLSVVLLAFVGWKACKAISDNEAPVNAAMELVMPPDVSTVGGYEIKTDNFHAKFVVNGEAKYATFAALDEKAKREVKLFSNATDLYVTDKQEETTIGSHDKIETEEPIVHVNPLTYFYNELKDVKFTFEKTESANCYDDTKEYNVYTGKQIMQMHDEQQIDCVVYTVKLMWTDNNEYVFKYYEYVDGSTLISAEAPAEINPLLTENTKWVVKMDGETPVVFNQETQESIQLNVLSVENTKGLSPNGSNTEVKNVEKIIHILCNKNDGKIAYIKMIENGHETAIKVINDFEMPDLKEFAFERQMTKSEKIQANFLISMLSMMI